MLWQALRKRREERQRFGKWFCHLGAVAYRRALRSGRAREDRGETTPSLTSFEPPLRSSGFVPTLRRSGLRRDKEDPAFVGLVDAKRVGTGVPAGPPQMDFVLCKSPLFFACRILVSLSLIGRGSPGTTIPTFTSGVDGADGEEETGANADGQGCARRIEWKIEGKPPLLSLRSSPPSGGGELKRGLVGLAGLVRLADVGGVSLPAGDGASTEASGEKKVIRAMIDSLALLFDLG